MYDPENEARLEGWQEGFKEGFLVAQEQSAEIAEDHNGCINLKCFSSSNCGATIANQIRQMEPK